MTSLILDAGTGVAPDFMDEYGDFRIVALSTDGGTSWGNPETIDRELRSFIQHGSLVEQENWTNRTLVVAVSITGAHMDDTATNEAALMRLLHRPATLAYTPATASVATVFPVITSTLVPTDDDFLESFENEVIYQIRFTCTPFVRAAELETIDAIIPGVATFTIEDITTTTGWTGHVFTGSTVTAGAGGVALNASLPLGYYNTYIATLEKTYSPVDLSDTPVVWVDWKTTTHPRVDISVPAFTALGVPTGGGPAVTTSGNHLADMPSPDQPGYTRSFFHFPTIESATTFTFGLIYTVARPFPGGGGFFTMVMTVDHLERTDDPGSLSPKQIVRTLPLKGVMPTTGSIEVHGTSSGTVAGLGDVMVYSYPQEGTDGYVPACMGYLQGAAPTADATSVSGYKVQINTSREFRVPAGKLPEGEYLIAAMVDLHLKASEAEQFIGINVNTKMGSTLLAAEEVRVTDVSAQYDDTVDGWQFVTIDTMHLPLAQSAANPAVYTSVLIGAGIGAGAAYLAELYLINITTGQMHRVSCGGYSKLWIDSPDLSNDGTPQVWVGSAADRSDQVSGFPLADAVDIHEFDPLKGVVVFVAATNPTDPPEVSYTYHRNYWYRVPPGESE